MIVLLLLASINMQWLECNYCPDFLHKYPIGLINSKQIIHISLHRITSYIKPNQRFGFLAILNWYFNFNTKTRNLMLVQFSYKMQRWHFLNKLVVKTRITARLKVSFVFLYYLLLIQYVTEDVMHFTVTKLLDNMEVTNYKTSFTLLLIRTNQPIKQLATNPNFYKPQIDANLKLNYVSHISSFTVWTLFMHWHKK